MNVVIEIKENDIPFIKPDICMNMEFSLREAEFYFSNIQKEISNCIDKFKKEQKERFGYCSEDDIKRFTETYILNKKIKLFDFDLIKIKGR